MGIDGIGGGGFPPGGVGGPNGPGGPKGAGKSDFSVPGTEGPEQVEGANASTTALERLQSGELNVDEYLDLRVSDATAHLQGSLGPEQLEFVRQSLREQLQTDPVLVELVKRATGQS